ncbi:hypothetical protein ACFLUT_01770 [Chloroflexota bacterium]
MGLRWWSIYVGARGSRRWQDDNFYIRPQRRYWAYGPFDSYEEAFVERGFAFQSSAEDYSEALKEFCRLERQGKVGIPREDYEHELMVPSGVGGERWLEENTVEWVPEDGAVLDRGRVEELYREMARKSLLGPHRF